MAQAGDRAAARAPGGAWNRLSLRQKRVIWAWSFLLVPLVFYALVRFFPTAQAFYLSLTKWNLTSPPTLVGFENFRRLIADQAFWQVFRNTALYLVIGAPVSIVIAFVVAYYLDRV